MHPAPSPQRQHRSQQLESLLAFLLIAYFAGKTIWLALKIGPGIFPDEETWFGISRIFSHSLLPPADSQASYQYGLITHVPTLYFWLMGKLLSVNITPINSLHFLRLCNVLLGLATVYTGWRTIRLVIPSPSIRLLGLAILTNTLMFTFLTAAVSYDNLANLLAATTVYYAVLFLLKRTLHSLLLMCIALLLGGLTKITLLPFAFFILVTLLLLGCRRPSAWRGELVRLRQACTATDLVLIAIALPLLAANTTLYLGNYLSFNTLQPQMDKIVGLENAMQYRIFARNHIFSQFQQGKISYYEAIALTDRIQHQGDRMGTLYLLQESLRQKTQPAAQRLRLALLPYSVTWIEMITGKIYGIMGHKSLIKQGRDLLPYYLLFGLALLLGLYFIRHLSPKPILFFFTVVTLGYTGIIMGLVNYRTYSHTGVIDLAVQGRYLFPVLLPFTILLTTGLGAPPQRKWQTAVAIIVTILVITLSFPWFVTHATPDWFAS